MSGMIILMNRMMGGLWRRGCEGFWGFDGEFWISWWALVVFVTVVGGCVLTTRWRLSLLTRDCDGLGDCHLAELAVSRGGVGSSWDRGC